MRTAAKVETLQEYLNFEVSLPFGDRIWQRQGCKYDIVVVGARKQPTDTVINQAKRMNYYRNTLLMNGEVKKELESKVFNDRTSLAAPVFQEGSLQ